MLDTCDDSLIGIRDRALLSFAWASGGRRRSEVAAARIGDLTALPDGTLLSRLAHSKTQQAGSKTGDADKPIAGRAATALRTWLDRAALRDGALFRRIRGSKVAEVLRPAAVAAIVQQRARLAGLDGDFGGHSLRSGFVSEAGRQEVSLPDVMALTGHTQVQSVIGYWRSGAGTTQRISRLLDHVEGPDPSSGKIARHRVRFQRMKGRDSAHDRALALLRAVRNKEPAQRGDPLDRELRAGLVVLGYAIKGITGVLTLTPAGLEALEQLERTQRHVKRGGASRDA